MIIKTSKQQVYHIFYRFSVINVVIDGIDWKRKWTSKFTCSHCCFSLAVKNNDMENSHWSKKSQNS